MTLKDIAQAELEKIKDNPILTDSEKLYMAGWRAGEWTCAKCGLMVGKNLKGESPFAIARKHANEHSTK